MIATVVIFEIESKRTSLVDFEYESAHIEDCTSRSVPDIGPEVPSIIKHNLCSDPERAARRGQDTDLVDTSPSSGRPEMMHGPRGPHDVGLINLNLLSAK